MLHFSWNYLRWWMEWLLNISIPSSEIKLNCERGDLTMFPALEIEPITHFVDPSNEHALQVIPASTLISIVFWHSLPHATVAPATAANSQKRKKNVYFRSARKLEWRTNTWGQRNRIWYTRIAKAFRMTFNCEWNDSFALSRWHFASAASSSLSVLARWWHVCVRCVRCASVHSARARRRMRFAAWRRRKRRWKSICQMQSIRKSSGCLLSCAYIGTTNTYACGCWAPTKSDAIRWTSSSRSTRSLERKSCYKKPNKVWGAHSHTHHGVRRAVPRS